MKNDLNDATFHKKRDLGRFGLPALFAAGLLVSSAVNGASLAAQTIPTVSAGLAGPNSQKLEGLASAPAAFAGAAMDGRFPRKEGPLTVLGEKPFEESDYFPAKDYWVKEPPRLSCDRPRVGCSNISHEVWHHEPGYTRLTKGTRQTVRIDDRSGFVRDEAADGALKGGSVGLLLGAVLGIHFLGLALGFLVAAGAALAVAGLAGGVKALVAQGEPEVFKRDVDVKTVYIHEWP